MARMTTEETAKDMGVPVQALRVMAQAGKLPFVVAVKQHSIYTYYIDKDRYRLWKQGKL